MRYGTITAHYEQIHQVHCRDCLEGFGHCSVGGAFNASPIPSSAYSTVDYLGKYLRYGNSSQSVPVFASRYYSRSRDMVISLAMQSNWSNALERHSTASSLGGAAR